MSKYIIEGDEVDFKNTYGAKDIVLKHSATGFALIFNSEVKFNYNVEYSTITLGTFEIALANSGNSLVINKDGNQLFELSPPS